MSPAEPRKRLPSADRRQQILRVAAELFVERGFEAVTMGDISAALGISRPTIYSYFPSTETLLDALLDERLHHLLGRLTPLLRSLRPPPNNDPVGPLADIFRLLLTERETLALLHSGGGPTVRARRHAFLGGLGAHLELHPDLPVRRDPDLLLIVTTLLESVAHRAATDPEIDARNLATTVARFVRGGAQEVAQRGEEPPEDR